jgi:hypothetical protein
MDDDDNDDDDDYYYYYICYEFIKFRIIAMFPPQKLARPPFSHSRSSKIWKVWCLGGGGGTVGTT